MPQIRQNDKSISNNDRPSCAQHKAVNHKKDTGDSIDDSELYDVFHHKREHQNNRGEVSNNFNSCKIHKLSVI